MPDFPASKWGSQDFNLGMSDSKAHVLHSLRILQMRRGYSKRDENVHPGRAREGRLTQTAPPQGQEEGWGLRAAEGGRGPDGIFC